MLFGSVPTPPKKPRSSTSTQSARHRMIPAHTATRATAALLLKKPNPTAARQTTRNRLTAQPWAASKAAKARQPRGDERRLRRLGHLLHHGGESARGIVTQLALPEARPGQACRTAMPVKKRPMPKRIVPAESPTGPDMFGKGHQQPRQDVEDHRPGGAEGPGEGRGEDAPEALAEDPDDEPPAPRRQGRRAATSSLAARRATRCRGRPGSTPPRPGP